MAARRSGRGTVLVLTTVHPPDDPRVRERTVGVLARDMPVRFATRVPGPADRNGFAWVGLPGNRVVRALRALREAVRSDVAVVSVHDPELIPVALVARLTGRGAVVDVHEDVPAQIRDKDWVPRALRVPLAAAAAALLRVAERFCVVTLAEDNYAHLFRRRHAVFRNYPLADDLPHAHPHGEGVIYVGDVTAARGAHTAVRAVARMDPRPVLTMIGRCREPLTSELIALAESSGVDLRLRGYLPHAAAMRHVAAAGVGISPLRGDPNHRDSLPSKVIEYLAVGIPVVASDLPGTRVVADLPGVQLVPAAQEDRWAAALRAALEEPSWREQARGGAAAVRERFTWPSEALRDLYRELLQRAAGLHAGSRTSVG